MERDNEAEIMWPLLEERRVSSHLTPSQTELEKLEQIRKMHRYFGQTQTPPLQERQHIFLLSQQELNPNSITSSLESSSHSTSLKLLPDLSNHLLQALKQRLELGE